jgi:shikimate kinase
VLVGLPGAGKSTVGRLAAARLGTHCTDPDPMIERATGLSVAELFADEGEAGFRARERRAVLEALELPPHVIAPGAGWAAEPGNLDTVAGAAFVIHLQVEPEVAAGRLAGESERPLLSGGDPKGRLQSLAGRRMPYYRRAAAEIDVSGLAPETAADAVVALARKQAGW